MAAPVNRLFRAMEAFFLADTAIQGLIGRAMSRGVSEQKIVALQDQTGSAVTKLGPFVEYEIESEERPKLLGAKSRFVVARVTFRFHGRDPVSAGKLYDAFYSKVHPTATPSTRYGGTWADETANEIAVMGAWWDDAAVTESFDDSLGMAILQAVLQVPYKAPATG